MKRNKKVKKSSRCTIASVNIVALVVLCFFSGMVYFWQEARCSALSQEIGKAEKELKKLERDCQREVANWDELKTPDRLRTALTRHCLDMDKPNHEQVVHMNRQGRPDPGQMSVARIRARRGRMDRVAELDGGKTMSPSTRAAAPVKRLPKVRR